MTLNMSPSGSPDASFTLDPDHSPTHENPMDNRTTLRQLTLANDPMVDSEDLFTIMVASDQHLGYADRDELRKMDSLRTFEEILRTAKEKKVDFILLGGDLFHENKPSRFTAQECAKLLRTYCMGDGGVGFELVSDPEINFSHMEKHFRRVNTEDPDLNINLPVYSIHGNHDDPSGSRYLSELDLLHTYGLINYFGKANDIDNIEINPLLFRKGRTSLAIYGLGSIRDERLHRAFLERKVKMKRPNEDTDKWFNVFVLHQNRPAVRGNHNYIPETFLDDFLDLVIWGHEHDPIPSPALNREKGFEVLQPGSSVATSMSEGEGKDKFCYILKVCGRRYRVEPIRLNTVRPFFIEEINIGEAGFRKDEANADIVRADVEKFLCKKMERIIQRSENARRPGQPKEPLVRLRVDFGNVEPLNPILFGQKFFGRVANPKDIILPMKVKPVSVNHPGHTRNDLDLKPLIVLDTTTIEDLVVDHFAKKADDHLQLFDAKFLSEILRQFVHNDDKEVLPEAYEFQKKQMLQYLTTAHVNIESRSDLSENLRKFREEHSEISQYVSDFAEWRTNRSKIVKQTSVQDNKKRAPAKDSPDEENGDDEMDESASLDLYPLTSSSLGSTGRNRGRGSRARGGGTGTRGRPSAISARDDDPQPSVSSTTGRTRASGRGRRRGNSAITDYFK